MSDTTPNETILWDICEAWLEAIVAEISATTAGEIRHAYVSPENPPPEDGEMIAVWSSGIQPQVGTRGEILGPRPVATVRARVRRFITMPDPNAGDGGLVSPLDLTRDAAVILADHWAIARSIPALPARIAAIEGIAGSVSKSDVTLDQMLTAGSAGLQGTDIQIKVVVPASLTAEC